MKGTIYSLLIIFVSCTPRSQEMTLSDLELQILDSIHHYEGFYGLAFKNLDDSSESIFINKKETFHAASTMKTPVMIEVFKQGFQNKFALDDSVGIKNEFSSIVDTSSYSLSPSADQNKDLYSRIGQYCPIKELVYHMITTSSNIATNMLVEMVGASNITSTMRELGATDIMVLRGVEDIKAYEAGLSNTTTAFDLMTIYEKIARKEVVSEEVCDQMITILKDQVSNEIIPAGLPPQAEVAHKTGAITGVNHDSGVVYLPDGRKYVLVILSKDWKNPEGSIKMMANISGLIYKYMMQPSKTG
ncbi:MAG: serine hydrolase [Cyclobacteriaceae bacterium]